MKCFNLTTLWFCAITTGLLLSSVDLEAVDPMDDLSLTLAAGVERGQYRLINEEQVIRILSDRLDLVPLSQIPRLARHMITLCNKFRFDPAFILALIQVESGFHVKAVSSVGALGLMQIMLPTAGFIVNKLGLRFSGYENFNYRQLKSKIESSPKNRSISAEIVLDPFINISMGITYLTWLRDHYKGFSNYYVLAAYNVGPARLDELLLTKRLNPTGTKKYYHDIRKGVSDFLFYRGRKPKRVSISI